MENKDIVNAILELTKIVKSNPDSAVQAADLTVKGMIAVALITVIVQLVVTFVIVRNEHRKSHIQAKLDKAKELDLQWHKDVQEHLANLVTVADPDIEQSSKQDLLKSVYSLNLLLDRNVPEQNSLNEAINELAACYDEWHKTNQRYKLQSNVIEAGQKVLYKSKI
ncbi:hypothetical protein BBM55_16100 [Vibrio parahaemolyticus]|uniref:hypothetical protein n=1 Tax=Vibrio parahaemolyticus TaxID=670 RepID=UPI00084A3971|nr:hypothetical protein [Vibrio parahaemolyticus]OEA15007.1 hypothetical protein BBM55_16100 [Vibrio parahaemolyticus]